METWMEKRQTAIHLLRANHPVTEVARILNCSERWVRKWRGRFQQSGWAGLESQSRRPHRCPRALPDEVHRAILIVRSELEAEAAGGQKLKYTGSQAIRTRLQEKGISPLPSCRTIERVLQQSGMTRPRSSQQKKLPLPRLQNIGPHTLIQVDIVSHFFYGGQSVACFNALEVGTRYPVGQASLQRRSEDALDFLLHVWKHIGVPTYTQMDNEGCFSGGATHPYVLGRVVRAALLVGTEPVFSAIREPESQRYIERFHQDYDHHVWEGTRFATLEEVNAQSAAFFAQYRQRPHPQLGGQSPQEVYQATPIRRLPADFALPRGRIPLYAGRVHFIRRVEKGQTIRVLNVSWPVGKAQFGQGVWATLEIQPGEAWLRVYDAAPDVAERKELAVHPFPLKEEVLVRPALPSDVPSSPASSPLSHHPPQWGEGIRRVFTQVRNDVLAVLSPLETR